MSKKSQDESQEMSQVHPPHSTEELRKRAKEALEKANQLIKETGKQQELKMPSQGDTTK